jgi:hypothetical protein
VSFVSSRFLFSSLSSVSPGPVLILVVAASFFLSSLIPHLSSPVSRPRFSSAHRCFDVRIPRYSCRPPRHFPSFYRFRHCFGLASKLRRPAARKRKLFRTFAVAVDISPRPAGHASEQLNRLQHGFLLGGPPNIIGHLPNSRLSVLLPVDRSCASSSTLYDPRTSSFALNQQGRPARVFNLRS